MKIPIQNPFSQWKKEREETRKRVEAEAARKITNQTARNERTLIETLESIDFINPRLPKKYLDHKTDESQKYGDLELAARSFARQIERNTLPASVDVLGIDQKLLEIALRYKYAIEYGEVQVAYAARSALSKGITELRCVVPIAQPKMIPQFVEISVEYLDKWLNLLDNAQMVDKDEAAVKALEAKYKAQRGEYKEQVRKMYADIAADPEKAAALEAIRRNENPDRSTWSDAQKDVYNLMLSQRFKGVTVDLTGRVHQSRYENFLMNKHVVENLSVALTAVPAAIDENAKAIAAETMRDLVMDMDKAAVQLEKAIEEMNSLEEKVKSLDYSRGQTLARYAAAGEAERELESIKKMQQVQIDDSAEQHRKALNSMGLLTKEQLEEAEKIREAAQEKEQIAGIEAENEESDEDQYEVEE